MRKQININADWLFYKGKGSVGESQGEKLSLPHTFNNVDGQDGGNNYFKGVTTYYHSFSDPREEKDSEVYLEFKAVNSVGIVFLNGQKIGEHKGGYSAFRFNITSYLKEENLLCVYVDNTILDDVYPTSADFTFYGGIYRDVNLIVVPKDHFDLDFFGSCGMKVDTKVEGRDGILKVHAYTHSSKEVHVFLSDKDGNLLLEGKNQEELKVANVHLWNGLEDPYLYVVRAELKDGETILDSVETKIGFRSYQVDPKQGFILNGKKYPLRGVALHQDKWAIGNALTMEDYKQTMSVVKELGCNTLRLAHYQHNDEFMNLCDEAGLVLWTEVPYISRHTKEGRENLFSQMKELIYQTYNHPSIFFRSLSNEITMKKADKKDRIETHIELNKMMKEEDPGRLTCMAGYAPISDFNKLIKIPDIFSFNFYFGWYAPFVFLNDIRLDFFHLTHPHKPVGLSEYGADGLPTIHASHPRRMDNSEEYQALYHEKMLKLISKRDYLWATHVWNLFDFGADGRNVAGDPGKNHKGLLAFDHELRKDAFYIYKAYWSKDPFVHICSKRFVNRTGKKLPLKVYSNQKEISVYANGKLVKTLTGEKVFHVSVPFDKEDLEIEVKSKDYSDKASFHHVDKEDTSYRSPEGNSYSWEK